MPLYDTEMFRDLRKPEENGEEPFDLSLRQPVVDRLYHHSSEVMSELADNSVSLFVTSPPYNVGKAYTEHHDESSLANYLSALLPIWRECYRTARIGGRLVINVAGIGRKPYVDLQSYLSIQCTEIGFIPMGWIIWNKGGSAGNGIAVGSWRSPHKPVLQDAHEFLLVFAKMSHALERAVSSDAPDITSREFRDFTKSIWNFPTVSAKRIGHPAPFPEELPYRCIKLLTYPNDLVVDPFCGSGTTCVVAKRCRRHYIGYDIDAQYLDLAQSRLADAGGLNDWL